MHIFDLLFPKLSNGPKNVQIGAFSVILATTTFPNSIIMKALVFGGERGAPNEVVTLKEDAVRPTPGQGQVLIRVMLTPIHPSVIAGLTPGVYPGPKKGECPGNEVCTCAGSPFFSPKILSASPIHSSSSSLSPGSQEGRFPPEKSDRVQR